METDFCTWTQLTDDEFDWRRQKGETFSVSTGPMVDHTKYTKSGSYAYIETSSPRKQGRNLCLFHWEKYYLVMLQSACLGFRDWQCYTLVCWEAPSK